MNNIDVYELVAHLCDLNQQAESDEVENALWAKYEIDIYNFEKIIKDLLPLIAVGTSPLTGTKFKGFSKVESGHGFWLAKVEAV